MSPWCANIATSVFTAVPAATSIAAHLQIEQLDKGATATTSVVAMAPAAHLPHEAPDGVCTASSY